ncbi:MAG: cupin domain-containing protein [Candidatus Marinimicrobia bacterium]|nr:cupin domain-containing protein [Candidatus Neomarinimicrobiota bacterium]
MIRKASDRMSEPRENLRGGAGTVTLHHFFKPDEITAPTRLCAEMTIPPGASIGLHEHQEEDELYFVTAGSGILSEGGREQRIHIGDAILTGNGGAHAVRNDGPEDLRIIAVILLYR